MLDSTQEELDKFKKYVIQQSKSNLSKQGRNVSSKLYNSIKGEAKVMPNSFSLEFMMEEYGAYLDQGVKGKNSSTKAPNSPFKFGSGKGKKGGLTNGIEKWVKARRFQFRDKETGKFLSYKSTAFLITRSIYSKGTKPTLFFTKPFEKAFDKLPESLVVKYGLDSLKLFNQTIKQPK
jgi:hypothetical protein